MTHDGPVTDEEISITPGPFGPELSTPVDNTVDSDKTRVYHEDIVSQIEIGRTQAAVMAGSQAEQIAELHAKVDHLTQGVGAVYQAVTQLVQMLQAVQQVARMMPGGKKFVQAMEQGGNNNG